MSDRGYALHSVCVQLFFFSFLDQLAACQLVKPFARRTANDRRSATYSAALGRPDSPRWRAPIHALPDSSISPSDPSLGSARLSTHAALNPARTRGLLTFCKSFFNFRPSSP